MKNDILDGDFACAYNEAMQIKGGRNNNPFSHQGKDKRR